MREHVEEAEPDLKEEDVIEAYASDLVMRVASLTIQMCGSKEDALNSVDLLALGIKEIIENYYSKQLN